MASLADYPDHKKPWWTDTCWYRCRICKACFQFPEALLKHKEKHVKTDSDSDEEIDKEEPGSSGTLETHPVLNSSVESADSPTEHMSNVSTNVNADSFANGNESAIEEKRLEEESLLDRTAEDNGNIIIPDPIMRCDKSRNSDEEVDVEDSSPVRELRHDDCRSHKSYSSLTSAGKREKLSSTVHPSYLCPFCKQKFSSQRIKDNHVENCERPFNYRRKTNSKSTRKPTVPKPKPSEGTVLRKQPKRKASSNNIKTSNIVARHAIRRIKEVKARAKRKVTYKCHVCQKILPGQQSLQIHIKQHLSKDKPFLCNICKLRFATKPGLTKHLITKHSKFRNYELSNC